MANKILKQDKIEALKAAGVELTGEEKVEELDALLVEHNIDLGGDDSNDNGDDGVDVSGSGVAHVYKGDTLVRSYNAKDHGKDYQKLARGYAGKVGGEVR